MKRVKVLLLSVLLLLPLAAVFAGPAATISEKPTMYQKDLSEKEMLAIINSDKGLLPIMLNKDGAFFNEEEKARVAEAAVAQVKAKNNHRSHYNAAVVFATYPYKLGLDEAWKLGASDAANAIRHATIALNLSSKSPANVPYMYLVRGLVRADQGLHYDGHDANYRLQDRELAKGALADFKEVARLAPSIAPYYRMADVAEVLDQKQAAENYRKLEEQAAQIRIAERAAAKKKQQQEKARFAKERVKRLFGFSQAK